MKITDQSISIRTSITRKPLLIALSVWASGSCLYAADSKPNVLLIVSDDLTASALSCYGNTTCRTPNIDRLADEGVLFSRAYCQYPVCGPSRASFMSGLYPNRTRMLGNSYTLGSYRVTNPALSDHPSIGGFLKGQGYSSIRVSKIYHMGVPGGIEAGDRGGDEPDSWDRAFDVMAPETASPGKLELLSPKNQHYGSNFARVIVDDEFESTQADHMAASQAIAILETAARYKKRGSNRDDTKFQRPKQPLFLAVGFVRPHVPLVAPQSHFSLYPDQEAILPHVPEGDLKDVPESAKRNENATKYGMNEVQQKKSLAAYYASVSFMDQQVGRLLDALDRLELRKNTIVIFTSDHGYLLGEHDSWQKSSFFEESTKVPLLVSAPGLESSAGRRSAAIVELIDFYPTIADLSGIGDQTPDILQGISLSSLLTNPSQAGDRKAAYTVLKGGAESLRTKRWRYSRWGERGEELYDHDSDPEEFTNLATVSEHDSVLMRMRQLLKAKRQASMN